MLEESKNIEKAKKKAQVIKSEKSEAKSVAEVVKVLTTLSDVIEANKNSKEISNSLKELSGSIQKSKPDFSSITQKIEELMKSITEKKMGVVISDTRPQIKLPEKFNLDLNPQVSEVMSSLLKEVKTLTSTVKNKPDSFRFDIKRNTGGYIDHVLVKPIK